MKTIAIDIRLIGKKRTGDETVFFHLTKALLALEKKTSERRYLLLTDEREPAKLALIRGRLNCIGQENVELVPLAGRNRFIWNLWTVPRFVRKRMVDIYHTQYIVPFFLPRRTKAVTLIHDVSFRAYPEHIAASDRFFLSLLIPRSLRRAAAVLAPSVFTKDEINKYYGVLPEKITVVPNAAQDIFAVPPRGSLEAVRRKYDLPATYLLYVGTLQPRKNLPFLLLAFAELRKKDPGAKLVLVGSRTAHNVDPRIDSIITELGLEKHVIFPGYVDEKDLPLVVRGARVFVFPSLYEGFGIPLLEAMCEEVPVVAADIPSLREVGKDAAVFVEVGDIAGLSEILYSLSIDPDRRRSLISAGRARIQEFTWPKSAEKLLALYRGL